MGRRPRHHDRACRRRFGAAGVDAPRPGPTRVEARAARRRKILVAEHGLGAGSAIDGFISTFEVLIQRVHVDDDVLMDGHADRIDPDKWRPLMFSFQEFYGLGPRLVEASTLGEIPESMYRTPDVERHAA